MWCFASGEGVQGLRKIYTLNLQIDDLISGGRKFGRRRWKKRVEHSNPTAIRISERHRVLKVEKKII